MSGEFKFSEIFNQERMDRCGKIAKSIFNKQRPKQPIRYKVYATEPVGGLPLEELAGKYFAVGYGGDQVTEVSFIDMLVILSFFKALFEGARQAKSQGTPEVQFVLKTEFTLAEAAEILSQFQIGTPHDEGKFLRIEIERKPKIEPED